MYVQNGNQNSGGISGEISNLSKGIGIVASMLLTPLVFNWTWRPILHYFVAVIGRDYAGMATWVVGAVEAYVLYSVATIGVTVATIRAVTAMIERGWKR